MELDELIGQGKLNVQTMVERGEVYGVEYDLAHTQELVEKHGLRLAGMWVTYGSANSDTFKNESSVLQQGEGVIP